MLTRKEKISTFVLLLFYVSGIIGIAIPSVRDFFLNKTAFNLCLTAGIYVWSMENYSKKMIFAFLAIFSIGYFVEVAGVWTGILFGEYSYGEPLGFKIFDVPLTIGINWFLLGFSSYTISKSIFTNRVFATLFAALAMTILDIIIEPVAIKLDFWSWEAITPPIQNYVMWFIVAVFVQIVLHTFDLKTKPKASFLVFGCQVLFFGLLNLAFMLT